MVCYHLQDKGRNVIGIDFRDEGFDKRAIDKGVNLLKMDASNLDFEDNYFDTVFSYDTFEHFSDPEKVLSEIYRVTKPGGKVYLEFGPLYNSPKGLHIYRYISTPYCQHLFSIETIDDFLFQSSKARIDRNHCNEWSLKKFRELFYAYEDKIKIKKYKEILDLNHLDIVDNYLKILKNNVDDFDELIVNGIEIYFEKK